MKINKEGYKIIGLTGVVCFLLWALMYYLMSRHAEAGLLWFGSILLVLFWFFIVAFFREPRRVKIHDAELVFAPCDGRVVVTEMVHESEYLDREMLQISIFMSITNVHMNWVPVGGTVEYFKYHPGCGQHEQCHQGTHAAAPSCNIEGIPVSAGRADIGALQIGIHPEDACPPMPQLRRDDLKSHRSLLEGGQGDAQPEKEQREGAQPGGLRSGQVPGPAQ